MGCGRFGPSARVAARPNYDLLNSLSSMRSCCGATLKMRNVLLWARRCDEFCSRLLQPEYLARVKIVDSLPEKEITSLLALADDRAVVQQVRKSAAVTLLPLLHLRGPS